MASGPFQPVDAASREITRIEQAILQGDDRLLEEQYGDLQAGLKRAPQGTGMEMLTTQVSKRRGTSWFSGPEPAYPLGPRFAGPRRGLAGGCAPFDPPEVCAPAGHGEHAGRGPPGRPRWNASTPGKSRNETQRQMPTSASARSERVAEGDPSRVWSQTLQTGRQAAGEHDGDARPEPRRRLRQKLDGLPARDLWTGATPRGRGRACENADGPAPVPGPRAWGSLPFPPE